MSVERLRRRALEKVWGSWNTEPLFPNTGKQIGEVWFESDHALPLLVKFLFTTEKLSVQVHPGDEYAKLHHNSLGKTEMWHVVSAEPGAQVAIGFREPVTRARLREASLSGEIEQLLEWWDARPGDRFFLPAGAVHAIGGGLVLCEMQQQSDITYRLYDYGRPRELHLDQGVEVSDLGPAHPRVDEVSCAYFNVKLLNVRGAQELAGGGMLAVVAGSGIVGAESAKAGDGFLVEGSVKLAGEMDALWGCGKTTG